MKHFKTFVQVPLEEFERFSDVLERVEDRLCSISSIKEGSKIDDPIFSNEIAETLGMKLKSLYVAKSNNSFPPGLIVKAPNSSRLVASRKKLTEWVLSNSKRFER